MNRAVLETEESRGTNWCRSRRTLAQVSSVRYQRKSIKPYIWTFVRLKQMAQYEEKKTPPKTFSLRYIDMSDISWQKIGKTLRCNQVTQASVDTAIKKSFFSLKPSEHSDHSKRTYKTIITSFKLSLKRRNLQQNSCPKTQ